MNSRGDEMDKWKDASKEQPKEGEEYLVLINGKYKKIRFVNAYAIGTYYAEEGWIIDGYEDATMLRVDYWTEMPELPAGVHRG